jgi:hypothetical protein
VVEPQEQNDCRLSLFRMHPNGVEICTFNLSPEVQDIKKSVCDAGIEGGIGTTTSVDKAAEEMVNSAEEVKNPGDSITKLNVPGPGIVNWHMALLGDSWQELIAGFADTEPTSSSLRELGKLSPFNGREAADHAVQRSSSSVVRLDFGTVDWICEQT